MTARYSALSRILPLFFLLFSFWVNAQTTPFFPEKEDEFVPKLGEFMTASKRPDMEEAFQVFKKNYKNGAFSPADMQRIIKVSNLLADQKLTAFPYYKNYINAVSAVRNDPDTALFNRWFGLTEQTLGGLASGKTKPIAQYLQFSVDFLENRSIRQGEAGAVNWKIKGGQFTFAYEDSKPVLRCSGVNLIGVRSMDSVEVKATNGIYYPFENIWQGEGGRVTWDEAGLDSTVYAVMSRYKIETVKPLFSCDTVSLYYPLYFPQGPIKGKFENNVVVQSKGQAVQYPRFESFDKTLKINKIGEGVEYVGGFKLWGSSVYGYGVPAEPAHLTVFNKKRQRIFYGTSQLFIIKREDRIVSEGVDSKLFMDDDSLFHPSAFFRLDIKNQIIELARGEKGSERNPFFSSFYNMNLDVEKISWFVNQDSLEIGSRPGMTKGIEQTVRFESSNRFDPSEYVRMQNISDRNPIATLYTLWLEKTKTDMTKERIVSDNEFAQALNPKFDYSSIQTLLAEMVAKGFINYYFDRHEIELRDKLVHYALASQGKKDYDSINIESKSTGTNAELNLKTKETTIYEVDKLELSSRQKVAVKPNEKEMTLLQNRDMRFGGRLFAGFALFEGKDMHFTYDKFQVEFDSVRHLDFYLPTGEKDPKTGAPQATAMNSTVEMVTGILLVDAPNNKSGKVDLEIFPSLQSKKPSFVFYDNPAIQSGVYKRDSFYFKLDPFSFNGLDSYTADQLKFKGEMQSAEIFPVFKETIVVRNEDKSFGFIHKTPANGYPTYSKKGNYTGTVDLSNKGFLGQGKVEYLTADIESEDIVFRPKQMTCTAKKFFMEEDRTNAVKVPQARGQDVQVNWLPYRDSMYVQSKAKAFDLFKAEGYTHKGMLILTPSGLKGRGEFEWAGGKLTSKIISYGPFQASADTADLQIKALDGTGIAFDSRNVDGELDFDAQSGHFKANLETATTTLPLDQYKTSMNEFTWDMKAQTIKFKSDEKKPGAFVSIDPGRDSLSFTGKTAFYDMKTNLLKIGGVEVIKSADAYIYPETGDIEIQEGGKMTQLKNARIVADTLTKYHTIDSATVDIEGKKLFKATGYYQYNIPGYPQEVFFNDIIGERRGPGTQATKNVLTTASGDLAEKDSFRMDIKTFFRGKIILKSNQPNLRFEGFSRLDADKLPNNQWFVMFSEVDKNDPTIRIKNAKNDKDEPLVAGFFVSKDVGECYPRVLLPPYSREDRMLLNCKDVYKYDVKTDRFTFGDSSKVAGQALRGSKMVFDNRVGTIQGEGPLSIGSGLKYMKVTTAGRLKSDFNKPDSVFHTVNGEFLSGVEITLPKTLWEAMLNDIRAASFDAPPVAYAQYGPFYQAALEEFVTDEKDRVEAQENLKNGLFYLPRKDNKYNILLGRHTVFWNDEYQSFVSTEDKIPLISLNGEPIGKMFTTYVEYRMPGNQDDRFYLYIRVSSELWYFFGYQGGALNVVSGSTRFNDMLIAMKPKDLQVKMPDGQTYEIVPANPSLADAFVNRVKAGRTKQ